MKAKQLETLREKHQQHINHGKTDEPKPSQCEIKKALVSGEPVKLKSAAQIIAKAKEQIACDRYGSDNLALSDIFQGPNLKLEEWKKKEAERLTRVKAYRAAAEPIIDRAELIEDADAVETMATIRELAKKHGLY